ncbi:MAG: hypothetical protein P8P37_00135 [Candidatus Marinimicrobia bacterium]|nr:hypothetical protein [Candidatus Neomarinimicrobiota bacterium]
MIKSLSPKTSMFATEQELREELTEKEYVYVKLAKLDEHISDLLHMTEKTNGELSMSASSKYNYIKEIQEDLLRTNRRANNKITNI